MVISDQIYVCIYISGLLFMSRPLAANKIGQNDVNNYQMLRTFVCICQSHSTLFIAQLARDKQKVVANVSI